MRRCALLLTCFFCLALFRTGSAGEIGFIEDFALSDDREAALEKLIPGTKDYYYYYCLHYQNQRQLDKSAEVLEKWIARHNRTARVRLMENRQALLRYGTQPEETLKFLRQRLGLRFQHHREIPGADPDIPTKLNPGLISRKTLTERALNRHKGTLKGFEESAFQWLAKKDFEEPELRRRFLHRLKWPDIPDLPRLVVEDLNYRHSRGFGSHPVHTKMTLKQLKECMKLKEDLRNNQKFVRAYLQKLTPGADIDWRHNPPKREAYLERLWDFASTLNPAFNSLKVHILYHRLVHDRSLGVYNKKRFMKYLKLPRRTGYINSRYLREAGRSKYIANLGKDFGSSTQLKKVGSDEPLVRSFLQHFFKTEETYRPYEPYIKEDYLKHVFAETKIVNGIGDMERWYSMLPPSKYRKLRERVDIDFSYTNKRVFGPEEQVGLDLYIKNVNDLIVKVFEINTLNYYTTKKSKINTAIDLDGLVPNEQKTHTFKTPPVRRIKHHFEFPSIKERGVYVIDFIGNGKSSRAVVRKGELNCIVRTSIAGHVFRIFDEENHVLKDAELQLAGHRYTPDEEGFITVPFTKKTTTQRIVLIHGDFACLDSFRHQSEDYKLSAGIYVNRESLLSRKKAKVIVRPQLTLNGTPVTLSVLEDPELVITTEDMEGVKTKKEVKGFELFEDRESVYEFKVPSKLSSIHFTLKAKVENLSKHKKQNLQTGKGFSLNGIDKTEKTEALYLSKIDGEYFLELLGKTGEPKVNRQVEVALKHRDFTDPVKVSLRTGERGRIELGECEDITSLRAEGPHGTKNGWDLTADRFVCRPVLHGKAGEVLCVPYMGEAGKAGRYGFALFEKRGGTLARDCFEKLSVEGGYLRISGLVPGDYVLLLKKQQRTVNVRITAGEKKEGYLFSESRGLELPKTEPLQIKTIEAGEKNVQIRLGNASGFTRVHVFATRFMPHYNVFQAMAIGPETGLRHFNLPPRESYYLTGRNIGEEYRYILERKNRKKYPGNMLSRPSLLLNPWAIRKTETGVQRAKGGGRFAREGDARGGGAGYAGKHGRRAVPEMRTFANLDFLKQTSPLFLNLKPDEKGVVTIKLEDLRGRQLLNVAAVDPENTVMREFSLSEGNVQFRDTRLSSQLEPGKHYTEKKKISFVKGGAALTIGDIRTSDFEIYDTLDKVYALFLTLSENPKLAEFGFILNWPDMDKEEKLKKYTKYACHELNFFVYNKDPGFFKEVVAPYLENKKDKTFMDEWLLGRDLTAYADPWRFEQLNVVERVLLGQKLEGTGERIKRLLKELLSERGPTDPETWNHLFKTALKGRALETAERYGIDEARKKLMPEKPAEAPPAPAGAPRDDKSAAGVKLKALAADKAEKAKHRKRALTKRAREQTELAERARREPKANAYFFKRDRGRRASVRQFYKGPEKTKEWVENNYYHLPLQKQDGDLIEVNPFWADYATNGQDGNFFSAHFAESAGNFPEMMLSLAVLDLPFKAEKHETEIDGASFTLRAKSPVFVFHKELSKAEKAGKAKEILVSENFYKCGERYKKEGNKRIDNFVTEEFLAGKVYGCQVVVTNCTSSRQKLDVLLQIPEGAIPVKSGHYTRSVNISLEPYRTWTADYFFYFPKPGRWPHYPVHVARNESIAAYAEPFTLNVVEKLKKVDRTSWEYLSQNGSNQEIIDYIKKHNVREIDLKRIAWRCQDAEFFDRLIPLLRKRLVYNHTLWSYSLKHNRPRAISEYLEHSGSFVKQCGPVIDCRLLTLDPVVRKIYQHKEYKPLVNARAHRLGKERKILNRNFYEQYMQFLTVLSYRRRLASEDYLSLAYYMFLQDRVEKGLHYFNRVKPRRIASKLQYDYAAAYASFYTGKLREGRAIAEEYKSYPVKRWRNLFAEVISQLDQIEGKAVEAVDKEDRAQRQTELAASEPGFTFTVEDGKITVDYQNLNRCSVSYYLLDIELLFSRNPFMKEQSARFDFIRPNATVQLELDPEKKTAEFAIPERFRNRNVMVEIKAAGVKKAQKHFANSLSVLVVENYGQVKVTHRESGKPLPKVYVKVYARKKGGGVQFYKDGYTDLRGLFDYTSLSTDELNRVEKFSILILSDKHGAVVREAEPPKR